jgi:RNA recognition motif. (a.k.a. RRM, RBD, or RNP domain)
MHLIFIFSLVFFIIILYLHLYLLLCPHLYPYLCLVSAEFRAYFERFGRVMSAEVMFNRETHKSRGFGFIVFELEKGAEHVCAEREHIIDGKVVSSVNV